MGKKTKLPPLDLSGFPESAESGRLRLPQISNAPLVSVVQGRSAQPVRRTRPGTGIQRALPNEPQLIPRVPTPLAPRDGQFPLVNSRARRPIASEIDLSLPTLQNQPPRNNLRLLRRQQMSRTSLVVPESDLQASPPHAEYTAYRPPMPNLTITGQKIYNPAVRSPCEGMEDPFPSFSPEAISFVELNSPELGRRCIPAPPEVPRLDLSGLGRRRTRYSPPRVFTPRDLPEIIHNDLRTPSPSGVPKLPPVKAKRVSRDE